MTSFTPIPGDPGALQATFGKVLVSLHPKAGRRTIWRDGAPAGEWPDPGYRVQVHGYMSSIASTLEAAKALGEFYGWTNNARNMRVRPPVRRHALSPEAAAAYVEAEIADSAALMARFPFTPREVESLKASRHHADILEPVPAAEIARRVAQLSAPIPLY